MGKASGDIEIAPGITAREWLSALENDKNKAIDILEKRIKSRFLSPANTLVEIETKDDHTPGFAILALCFLTIETLQGFREGMKDHRGCSRGLFVRFLKTWEPFMSTVSEPEKEERAKDFFARGRCALLHSGSTDFIRITSKTGEAIKLMSDESWQINRTKFLKELTIYFDEYLRRLKSSDDGEFYSHFRTKAEFICRPSENAEK